jgi:hypothetical protein
VIFLTQIARGIRVLIASLLLLYVAAVVVVASIAV